MTSSILFAGQEDLSFTTFGMVVAATGVLQVDTTTGRFRSGYARHALSMWLGGTNNGVPQNSQFLRTQSFSSSNFWSTFRICAQSAVGNPISGAHFLRWVDSSSVVRLRVRNTSTGTNTFVIEKVTAAGVATQLGSAWISGLTTNPNPPDKLDIFINYAVAGQITIYINAVQVYTYAGDVTTDSATTLAYFDIGGYYTPANASNGQNLTQSVSEIIVSTIDTRNMNLVTQVSSAAGNTDTFTSGVYSNVNTNLTNYVTPDYSITAGQIQEYKVTPAIPTGNFSVVSVVDHAMVTAGTSGPTHFEFVKRVSGADYTSSSIAAPAGWGLLVNNWDLNPATSAAWATTDLAASSTNFNLGYESVT